MQIDSDANSLLLKVVDEGRGIPADKLESVFDRFQQVESSDASKKGGTGLGLAICRSIIQQHGGAIWAQPNQHGTGTTLWVQLSRSARASDTGGSASLAALPAERGEGLILVCDDDPGIRVVVAEQLRQHGYDILEAGSGEEVIALANEQTAQAAQGRGTREHAPVPAISAILLDLVYAWAERLGDAAAAEGVARDRRDSGGDPERDSADGPASACAAARRAGCRSHSTRICCWPSWGACCGPTEGRAGSCWWRRTRAWPRRFSQGSTRRRCGWTTRRRCGRPWICCLAGAPDLMILDLTLPDGDGFSLVDWLRRQPALHALPLVVYSSRADLRSRDGEAAPRADGIPRQGEGPAPRGGRAGARHGAAACVTRWLCHRQPDGMRD